MKNATKIVRLVVLTGACALAVGWLRAADDARQASAREIIDASGVKGGLIVHVGCGDGRLTAALRLNDSFLVHGLDASADNVEAAREHIRSLGLYGKISVDRCIGDRLPYVDNLVNLLVSEDLGEVRTAEVLRVLAPDGVAYVKRAGKWRKTVKPRPEEIDEWTHYLHDAGGNAVAHDSVIGPPRRMQWVGSPRWARHHDHMASMSALVSAGGRIFYIFDEGPTAAIELPPSWTLIARDAFNGTILWKRPIAQWHTHLWPLKSGPAQLPRRLVAVGDRVYVTLGIDAPLTALDAATGETVRTYPGSQATEEVIASDGVLFLLVNGAATAQESAEAGYESVDDVKLDARERAWDAPERWVMAVQADTGQVLWRKAQRVVPLTLAADGERVLFHDGEKVVCLDRRSGDELWTSAPLACWSTIRTWFAPTLVVYQDVVIFSGGETMVPHYGADNSMTALSVQTGETLWTAQHPPSGYQSPEDILVAGGLVWTGATTQGGYSGVFTGRDPLTGEVKNEFPPDLETYWFHHRCYRGKATDRYLLMSRTGIEFLDIQANHWIPHHWVRGGCLYGIMPCNGLIYAPAHSCACYMEAKQYGFNALAPASATHQIPREVPDEGRLERGPAYGQEIAGASASPNEWPTYRHDSARSGRTTQSLPVNLARAWEAELGGKLSTVVIAGDRLFVASVDTHTVHALDATDGKRLWSYAAGGRVDSPPTIYEGRALFGSADGWVYCIRAGDGELIWRFRAAPEDRRLTAFEQVESVWPVHGSVLVQDDVAYCVAGRSMFLDGGLRLLRLDPKTGQKLSETILDDRDPETGENLQMYVKGLNMTVALPDILSSDGQNVYMRSLPFDLEGGRQKIAYTEVTQQHGENVHLFSPTGFLDDTWWHRSYWVWGRSMASGAGGYYLAGKVAPAGRILVFDDASVYGFGRKPKYFKWTTPLEYHLFAASRELPEVQRPARRASGSCVMVENSESLNPANRPIAVEAWVRATDGDGVVLARGAGSHGYALYLKGGKPQFAIRVDKEVSAVGADEDVVGEWVHLAGVLTADKQLQIYVNGKLSGSAEASGFIAGDPHEPMEIGADEGGAAGDYTPPLGLKGLIDEVRIYDGALTAAEVEKHHASPQETAAADAALVLHYSFEEGKAADGSGNQNDGTVEGAQPAEGKFAGALRFKGVKRRRKPVLPFVVEHDWSHEIPLHVRAILLADETLFIAGPPDVVNEEQVYRSLSDAELRTQLDEQIAALEGRKGALLWAVSASDGERLAEYELESVPVFDGMAAANGRLFLVTSDGMVLCFAGG